MIFAACIQTDCNFAAQRVSHQISAKRAQARMSVRCVPSLHCEAHVRTFQEPSLSFRV